MLQYEEYYIEDNGDYYREIPTSSFLAGVLFCKNKIDFMTEYSKLQEDFERKYKIAVSGQESLGVKIAVEGTTIRLIDDYNKVINVNGRVMDVRSYLYSLTTPEVRDYFGIEEPRTNTISNYWRYIFSNKSKTK